jgi:oxygen-independent coproporphyrinogen-3 oxidase
MYVHIPFCEERCAYCGCNVVISPHRGPETGYLAALETELDLLADALGGRRRINQLHWGGGTPTYLSPAQCEGLFRAITDRFPLVEEAEAGIEIDPCVTSLDHLRTLRGLGFNRLSMGVQDVDPEVQRRVGRHQPLSLTAEHIAEARRLGFASTNIDLIYGLPGQSEASFRSSARTVLEELAPDRVACFSYAHVPWIKPHQRQLEGQPLPRGWEKFRLFAAAVEEFCSAGYRFVGFDHFARPDDELALALEAGTLHRNFMGYTVMPATDQVGVGVTAIGDVGGAYAANERNLARYERQLAEGRLPVDRGFPRSHEDELRGTAIRQLICHLTLDLRSFGERFGMDAENHFAEAIDELREPARDGLVEITRDLIRVTPRGRFFLRNICMPFDTYLAKDAGKPLFSRTV